MNRIVSALVLATAASLWMISPSHAGRDEVFRNANPDRTWTSKAGGYFSRARNYAVVISISEYIGGDKGGFQKLGTQNDAEKMKNFLLNDAGFDYVRVITDEKVTKTTIDQLMTDEVPAMVGPNDRFVFYWSGHGTQRVRGDTNSAFGFLPLYDSKANAYSSMVSMEDISRWNAYLSARHALFILDACLSGLAGAQKKASPADTRLEQLSQPARYLISAGTAKEETIAGQRWGGSLFTEAFIGAARAGAADEVISIYKLIDRIQERVVIEKLNAGWQMGLTPQIHDLMGSYGAFYFVAKGTPSPAPPGATPPGTASTNTAAVAPETKDGAVPGPSNLPGAAPAPPGVQPPPPQLPPPGAPTATPAPRIDPAALPQLAWKLQNAFPGTTSTSLPLFVRRVGELSGQRLKMESLAMGTVGANYQMLDAVASSKIETGYAPGTYFVGKDVAFALMAAIPFGFTPREQLAFRRRADVSAIFDRLSARHGVVTRPCGLFGRRGEFWLRKRIATAGDLAGMKLRIASPFGQDIYKEFGVQIMVLTGGEIVPYLERGLLDGAQFGSPTEDQVLGLARQAKYYYYPSSVHPSLVTDLFINKKAWDALPPAGRQIIEQACLEATETMISDYERTDQEALAKFARDGITVGRMPASIEKELYAASRKVLTKSAGENPVIRDVMAIVEQMRPSTVAAQLR